MKSTTRIVILFLLLSCFSIAVFARNVPVLSDSPDESVKSDYQENLLKNEQRAAASNEFIGRPLEVCQHSTYTRAYHPYIFPSNVSVTLAEGWTSNNVSISFDGVQKQEDYVVNGYFDSNDDNWNFHRDSVTGIFYDDHLSTAECIEITADDGQFAEGDIAYYEQTIELNNSFAANKMLSFSIDYYLDPNGDYNGFDLVSAYIAVDVDGIEKNLTIPTSDLDVNTWSELNLVYDPGKEGQICPDNITLKAGMVFTDSLTVTENREFRIDSIECYIWTAIQESNIVYAHDHIDNKNYTYQSTESGKGKIFIDTAREASQTEEMVFTIFRNSSYGGEIEIFNIILESDLEKCFNTTQGGQTGSLYSFSQTDIIWNTSLLFEIPYGYMDNWAVVSKPISWTVTHIFDSFDENHITECSGIEAGSDTFHIPKSILNPGLWHLAASSDNLVEKTEVLETTDGIFNENSCFFPNNDFMVNITLQGDTPLADSQCNFSIYYPNGSLFYNESVYPSQHHITFGNFSITEIIPIGPYDIEFLWTDSNSSLSRSRIGYWHGAFQVWHSTELKAVETGIFVKLGEPLLLRVNYTDDLDNQPIVFGTLTYNSTFGQEGDMAYLGSGIYVADIDTSDLSLGGNYYISVNASQEYYESQSAKNIISFEVTAQSLKLEIGRNLVNTIGNSYAEIRVNVTGADTGALLWDSNISTSWHKVNNILHHDNGTYTLNISTEGLPLSGSREIYTMTISANKTYYGTVSEQVSVSISPVASTISVNETVLNVYLGDCGFANITYMAEETGKFIENSQLKVDWYSSYTIINHTSSFLLNLSTEGLSVGTFTAILTAESGCYETKVAGLTIVISPTDSELVILNDLPVEFIKGDLVYLKCQYLVKSACYLSGELSLLGSLEGDFILNGSTYIMPINTSELAIKSYICQVIATGTDIETQLEDIIFRILPLELEVRTNIRSLIYDENKGNKMFFDVFDISHDCCTVNHTVTVTIGDHYEILNPLSNGSYEIDFNDIELSPSVEPYSMEINVQNKYGESIEKIITVSVPIQDGRDPDLLVTIMLAVAIIGIVSILAAASRFKAHTKMQRLIETERKMLKKRKFKPIINKTRTQMIEEITLSNMPSELQEQVPSQILKLKKNRE